MGACSTADAVAYIRRNPADPTLYGYTCNSRSTHSAGWWNRYIRKLARSANAEIISGMAAKPPVGQPAVAPADITSSQPGSLPNPLAQVTGKVVTPADANRVINALNNVGGRVFGVEQAIGAPRIQTANSAAAGTPAAAGKPVDLTTILILAGAAVLVWLLVSGRIRL